MKRIILSLNYGQGVYKTLTLGSRTLGDQLLSRVRPVLLTGETSGGH